MIGSQKNSLVVFPSLRKKISRLKNGLRIKRHTRYIGKMMINQAKMVVHIMIMIVRIEIMLVEAEK